jgi:hypothetical protein
MLDPVKFEWLGQVETADLTEKARFQLRQLLSFGVEPIGKTKARGQVRLTDSEKRAGASAYPTWTITLQTPALLIDPDKPLHGENELRAEYARVWDELSGGSLSLDSKAYFQSCSLAGGEYFRRRFSKDRDLYKPYLLTDAGSTFRLKPVSGREADAAACIEKWMLKGLPLSTSVCEFYGIPDAPSEMWRHCPYLPENGYGEIHAGGFDVPA